MCTRGHFDFWCHQPPTIYRAISLRHDNSMAGTQSVSKPAKRSRAPSGEPLGDFIWPLQEEELQEDG